MSGKFNPREMLKRTFSGGSSKTSDGDDTPRSPLRSPNGPVSPSSNPTGGSPFIPGSDASRRVPSLRAVPDANAVLSSSNPLGMLRNARAPAASSSGSDASSTVPPPRQNRLLDLMNRRNTQSANAHAGGPGMASGGIISSMATNSAPLRGNQPSISPSVGGFALNIPGRPGLSSQTQSAPAFVPGKKGGLAARRGLMGKMKLTDAAGGGLAGASSSVGAASGTAPGSFGGGNSMDEFRDIMNPEEGWLTFNGAATITRDGVKFANGNAYKMSLDEIESLGELGKGNYGTVYKVRHARNSQPRIGFGLSGKQTIPGTLTHSATDPSISTGTVGTSAVAKAMEKNKNKGRSEGIEQLTGTVMAMKEIRMELDKAKFKTIAKELLILHQCASPYIIDFYGAFMQDGFVYMCIEYMDGGSVDKLYSRGVPEDVLQHITLATILGLNELKEKHNIIHRDVKPTNILVNTRGQVKICDFGVSGDLVASKARTNIGCQSYMPPERINSGGMSGNLPGDVDATYGVQSDIWSLGLSIIECALGKYPYEVTDSILVQLNAIVQGEAPTLPQEGFSPAAHDFVARCLAKAPGQRPAYTGLLRHPWLSSITKPTAVTKDDEEEPDVEKVTSGVKNVELLESQATTPPALGTGLRHVQQPDDRLVADWVKAQLQRKATEAEAEAKAKS